MDRELIHEINSHTFQVWEFIVKRNPELIRYQMPSVTLNGRLWRTAGLCYQRLAIVQLGSKFFAQGHTRYMLEVILPHEIIHYADYCLFGESELHCGHGMGWQFLMRQYGLPPDPYHSMRITR